ncbi:hypothetical protein BDN71DRAFT_1440529, partial [Pleurotus eryngii]
TENFPMSATVGAPLVKELKVGVSTPESWNDFKLPSLCLYVQHYLTNHYYAHLGNYSKGPTPTCPTQPVSTGCSV